LEACGGIILFPAGYQEIASVVPQNYIIENQLLTLFSDGVTVRFRSTGCPVLGWKGGYRAVVGMIRERRGDD